MSNMVLSMFLPQKAKLLWIIEHLLWNFLYLCSRNYSFIEKNVKIRKQHEADSGYSGTGV